MKLSLSPTIARMLLLDSLQRQQGWMQKVEGFISYTGLAHIEKCLHFSCVVLLGNEGNIVTLLIKPANIDDHWSCSQSLVKVRLDIIPIHDVSGGTLFLWILFAATTAKALNIYKSLYVAAVPSQMYKSITICPNSAFHLWRNLIILEVHHLIITVGGRFQA